MKKTITIRNRTAVCLSAAAVLIVVGGWLNRTLLGDHQSPMSESAFYINKVWAPADYDVVTAGNSRMLQALSSSAMNEELPGLRILNLGLDGACLTPQMFQILESKLDPDSSLRMMILGVEPGAMNAFSSANFKLNVELNRSGEDRFIARNGDDLARWFTPVRPFDVMRALSLAIRGPTLNQPRAVREFHYDGWKATMIDPMPDYPMSFDELSDEVRAFNPSYQTPLPYWPIVLDHVQDLAGRGIVVFGLRLPADAKSRLEEDRRFPFDEDVVEEAFEQAGGYWISLDPAHYETYDRSHLHKESAIRYSRDVAAAIRKRLEADGITFE